ncbi:hypothetical protein ACFU44_03900 [Nocardia rhizosphaerihabitans]|uniref:TRADD-N-associated membrane domain-containing protein n=1 Tax=Nocardia rhizosphaerihabitans TaxID=1691570 RepID=UPI00366CBD6A
MADSGPGNGIPNSSQPAGSRLSTGFGRFSQWLNQNSTTVLFLAAVLIAGGGVAAAATTGQDGIYGGVIIGALAVVSFVVTITWIPRLGRRSRSDAALARGNLDRAVEAVSEPSDLLKLMEVNRRQMEAYDVQARAQGRSSHRSSLFAMTAGLMIVGAGLWITVNADDSATKYSAAIVAAVGTATGGYIARTFIRVNTSAQQHVRYYFEQPLVQSYLLTAERVAERLPERRRGNQYELIVAAALHQAGMVPQLRDATDEPESDPEPSEEPDPAAEEGPGESAKE